MMRPFETSQGLRLGCLLVTILLSVPALGQQDDTAATTVATESVTLAYAPEDQSMFDIIETYRRSVTIGEQEAIVDERERTSRVLITCTDEGYVNTVTVLSQNLSRDGMVVANPVNAAMANLMLTYNLSKEGTLTGISGYEMLPEKMREQFDNQVASTMIRMLNLASLTRRDEEAYKALYDGLIGKSVTVGEMSISADAHALPRGGSKTLYTVESSRRDMDGFLTLKWTRGSIAANLATEIEGVEVAALEAAATAAGVMDEIPEDHADATVAGVKTIVIDPTGLLVGSLEDMITYRLEINSEGDEMATMHTISEESTFEATVVEQTEMQAAEPQQ